MTRRAVASLPAYQCPKCGRKSAHPKDAENRFCVECGFEEINVLAATLVRLRLRTATQHARDSLWSARGGLHHLQPFQAAQFAATLRHLDQLIRDLGD